MSKYIIVGLIGAALVCGSAIWWLSQENQVDQDVTKTVEIELPVPSETAVKAPQSKPIPVEDMRHLAKNNIVVTKPPEKVVDKPKVDKPKGVPEDLVIYQTSEGQQPSYTLKQYDTQGKIVGEIQVIEETIQANGQVAVTLALDNGMKQTQVKAVPNAEQRGYAIDLDAWEYAELAFEELVVVFNNGDKLAGLQIGYIMLQQGKLKQGIPFLVDAAKVSGFSRPLDMIANNYFKRGDVFNTAVWGRLASAYSGFDDWGARISLMREDMEKVEARVAQLRQQYQLK